MSSLTHTLTQVVTKRAKKASAEDTAATLDWAGLVSEGALSTQTVPVLKVFLKDNGLPLSGNKADLMKSIGEFFAAGS